MACDCIEQMRKRGNAVLHVTKTDAGERFSLGAPYRPTMEEGKKVVEYVANFCPICGKAYNDNPSENEDLNIHQYDDFTERINFQKKIVTYVKRNGTATVCIEMLQDCATILSVDMKDIPGIDSKQRYYYLIWFFTKHLREELKIKRVMVMCYSSWQVEMCHRNGYEIWKNPLQSNFCLIMMI